MIVADTWILELAENVSVLLLRVGIPDSTSYWGSLSPNPLSPPKEMLGNTSTLRDIIKLHVF